MHTWYTNPLIRAGRTLKSHRLLRSIPIYNEPAIIIESYLDSCGKYQTQGNNCLL